MKNVEGFTLIDDDRRLLYGAHPFTPTKDAMAAKKKEEKQEQQTLPGPTYPVIEKFIETATAEKIADVFGALKKELTGLKGPKADQAKKVVKAVERTEELLSYLLQVREKLESDRKGKGGSRK